MPAEIPPPPEAPQPKGSWLAVVLAFVLCVILVGVFSVLTLGVIGPAIVLGAILAIVILLQYVIWGWYFERIYGPAVRMREAQEAAKPPKNDEGYSVATLFSIGMVVIGSIVLIVLIAARINNFRQLGNGG